MIQEFIVWFLGPELSIVFGVFLGMFFFGYVIIKFIKHEDSDFKEKKK